MITGMSHTCVYVLDQDEAKAFYTGSLGFEEREDVRLGDYRWLTVGPKGRPDVTIVLSAIGAPHFDEETAEQMRAVVSKGAMGPGVMGTDDCHKTFEELSARGVEFAQEPADRPYGIEAVFRDNSGNWFSLTQRKS
ncbi:VOC family protein [Nonomuraea dietziae]|uniref:VOC family protein n=1 Tax=Nonomuraea dietziae TaxID=65515 RepID=UPI003402FCB1